VTSQLCDQSRDTSAVAVGLFGRAWGCRVEASREVAVAKAVDGVGSSEDGLEQLAILSAHRVEAGVEPA
jgi:hypothetical protein